MSVHRCFCVIISHDMAISELITITSSLAESLNYFGSCLHSLFHRFHEHHVTPLPSFSSYRLQQHHPRDAILPQQFSVSCYSSCMASEQPLALRPIPPGSSSSPLEQLFFLCVKCRRSWDCFLVVPLGVWIHRFCSVPFCSIRFCHGLQPYRSVFSGGG